MRASVSAEAETANQPGPFSVTLKHTPAQAIEAPMAVSSRSNEVAMRKRRSPPGMTSRTWPTSLTIPVNMAA